MDEKTLIALKGSIAKWEGIVAGTVKDEGQDNCPLCQQFIDEGCVACPVMGVTGHSGCWGSPYDDYAALEEGYGSEEYESVRDAAQAELDFLRSLLPDEAANV
jgi:hypothetical protein